MAYSIASIKGVLENGKAVLQGSLSPEEYPELNECIVAAEEKLHEYLVSMRAHQDLSAI